MACTSEVECFLQDVVRNCFLEDLGLASRLQWGQQLLGRRHRRTPILWSFLQHFPFSPFRSPVSLFSFHKLSINCGELRFFSNSKPSPKSSCGLWHYPLPADNDRNFISCVVNSLGFSPQHTKLDGWKALTGLRRVSAGDGEPSFIPVDIQMPGG